MSIVGEDRLGEGNVEYNHRDDNCDEQSEIGSEAIEVIREIFTPKETGIKVNPQRKLFPSPAAEERKERKKRKKNEILAKKRKRHTKTTH